MGITAEDIDRRMMAKTNQELRKAVEDKCWVVRDQGKAILVRGLVTKVQCQRCRGFRWDDGTPCSHVVSSDGVTKNVCGAYYRGYHERAND